jgi:hypothetical protein
MICQDWDPKARHGSLKTASGLTDVLPRQCKANVREFVNYLIGNPAMESRDVLGARFDLPSAEASAIHKRLGSKNDKRARLTARIQQERARLGLDVRRVPPPGTLANVKLPDLKGHVPGLDAILPTESTPSHIQSSNAGDRLVCSRMHFELAGTMATTDAAQAAGWIKGYREIALTVQEARRDLLAAGR